ncbi:hypothetical protein BD309DRAFT_1012068 [Dichomitus squalens]|nr:hypothetical protein BD309DRAFT_1012068 [Dichomitus squalens]
MSRNLVLSCIFLLALCIISMIVLQDHEITFYMKGAIEELFRPAATAGGQWEIPPEAITEWAKKYRSDKAANEDGVYRVALSPDRLYIASGSYDTKGILCGGTSDALIQELTSGVLPACQFDACDYWLANKAVARKECSEGSDAQFSDGARNTWVVPSIS